MKAWVREIPTNRSYERVVEWSRLISITGFSQVLIQAAGLIGGILVIRLLPTHEYGWYTLANTMLGTMIVLADGGVSTSVLAQGGKVWQSKEKLGKVLATGLYLRKKFAVASLLVATPILLYLLRHHNASWLTSIMVLGALFPAFFIALSSNLITIAPSLHQAIVPLQKISVGVSLGRLAMLLLTLFFFPFAYIAIASASIPQIFGNIRLKRISTGYADWHQEPDPAIQKEILGVVKRILPGSIYYCLSGQIIIWIISIFGTTAAVAQIGALGRLSMILGLFSAIFGILIVPRFARLKDEKRLLLKRFIQIQFGLVSLFAVIILLVSIFPTQLLWILGENYSGLEKELVLSIAGSSVSLLAGLLFTVSTSRNWAINPFISIPLTITAIVCGVLLINISSLIGVLTFSLFVSSVEVIMYSVYCISKITRGPKPMF